MQGYLAIFIAFFGWALCFPRNFLKAILSSIPETIQFSDFPLEKYIYISQALKQQMLVTSTCLNLLPQLLLLQEKFENFGLSNTKSVYFYDKNNRYLEGFSRYFQKIFCRDIKKIFWDFRKDIYAIFHDICGKA